MGTVIVTASGKGGTGKTSFCSGVSVALCALGEKVLLIDADAGLRSLDLVLGMTDSLLFSYADVIFGRASLKEASVPHPVVQNLRVLTAPSSLETCNSISRSGIESLVQRAREHFSYTVVDCSAGLGSDIISFGAAADRVAIVSTADYTSLRGAQTAATAFFEAGVTDIRIVVNRVRPSDLHREDSITIDKAMDASGLALLGVVPEDKDIITCSNRGQVLMLHSAGSGQQGYMNIARRLRGERVKLFAGIRGRF